MSTPPSSTTSGVPEVRLSSSTSSSPHPPTRSLSGADENQSFSALPPEHSVPSPGDSTVHLSRRDDCARNSNQIAGGGGHGSKNMSARTIANIPRDSILLSPANTKFDTSPTPSVILTHHHHDDGKASSAPTSPMERVSPPASLVPVSSSERSDLFRYLQRQHHEPQGDTPPNGVPRKWWSRSPSKERGRSVSPSRGRSVPFLRGIFRDPVVFSPGSGSNLSMPDDFTERETPLSSSLPNDLSLAPLSNNLLSLSREDLQIRDLDEKNSSDEDGGNEHSLLLSSPEATPATLVSPALPVTAHMYPQTLKSLGIGIEEGLRRDDIENSYWSKLLKMSPKSSPKSLSADLGTSASASETTPQVEEGLVVSMEAWDGKSLDVPPSVMSLDSSSPTKGKALGLPNLAVSSTLPQKRAYPGKGKGQAQDAPHKEPSTSTPQAHSKHLESWFDKFTHRQSAKGQEKENKETESWLRTRENVSLALNAVLSTSELAQLSETGKAFAMEGHVARTTAEQGNGKDAKASSGTKKGAVTETYQGTESKIGTSQKAWLTVKSTATFVSPMLRTSLMILGDVAKLTPIHGLHEAARILLAVWEAVDEVETNRLQCLRLTERCAMAIYSVRAEIADAERDMQSQQGQTGDVGVVGLAEEMEGPVRKLNECIEMVYNFLLKLNRRPFLKRFLRSDEIQEEILACDKALGDAMQMFSISIQIRILKEFKRFARDTRLDPVHHAQGPTPPPVYASPLSPTLPISLDRTPTVGTPALPEPHDILPATSGLSRSPPAQNTPLSSVQSQTNDTDPPSDAPISPLTELQDLHVVENASDREQDRALFRSTLQRAISARRDAEVLQVLEVRPGEVPEALKALRRAEESLRGEREANERKGGDLIDEGLERVFMETGIEAMTRLSSVAVQKAENQDVDVPWDLPPWTITRYEVDRLTMIGSGSFSKVYLGSWSGRRVAIKVLSLHTPAPLFRKAVEIWRKLKHENVLGMWGASSAQGERPWFMVSEYCSGGSLVGWLRERKGRVGETSAGGALTPPSAGAKGDVDLLRCMHHISKGMVYLHDQNVLHEDLKASNVLVDDNGRCVISDFGQSEMKWEASRGGGKPITNGTLRWQAPELLNGPMRLSTATDVYAFSICCIEILGMGDLPYGHRDDTLVAFLVNYQNKRPEIPSTPITSLVEPLIQECWVRDPEQRPTFTHIAATLKRLRKHQGGVEESPIPVQAEVLLTAWSDPPHHSPSMHPLELPETSPSTLQEGQVMLENDLDASVGGDEFGTASEGTGRLVPGDAESVSTTSRESQPKPFYPIGQPRSNPSYHWEPTVDSHTGNMEMPEGKYSGIAIYTPTRKLSLAETDSMSSASSHLTSSPEAEHSALEEVRRRRRSPHVALDKPSLPMDEQLAERKNELRFRSLAQSSHDFHHSLTLPLWSPSHVELGAVGYLSAPKGEFITLFNAMKPQQTAGSKVTNIPSLGGYLEGPIRIGKKSDSIRTMTQRGLELISGLLTFPLIDRDGSYSERISRRHPFPLRAGHKAAFIYAESTMYRFIEDLAAPKDWFKANVNTIVKEYAPYHPIQKEDVILVFGTLSAPEYALFVSHSHPNGQAHFNVFSDRQSGRPWGTFTTDTEYPSDEGGPSYIEEIPRKAVFASKVSPVRLNAGSNDKDWDTLVLARLRFPTDATEPTSQ
ncbi:uncharacterized protein F5891DRAFT_1243087 [Suillus fuscotomentosus]|uniref:Protein kinase domain-containing protein n=1 Tax=Suillus fuscotomentosus TaxID=1912939 RepID=A0AAD4DZY1_9AGAM|nr:uncharacterized protein F5891DRAFT_1243087 [Suillus fuscotomentosus]KAG1897189.1 hypothetical protein F5891DRAFT_1243087 [Suillus fuscotomentosus]